MSERRGGFPALALLVLGTARLAAQEPPADPPPAAGVHVTVKANRGEATIESNDPNVEVVVTKGGRIVRIIDPQSKQTWELDAEKCELRPTGQPGGLAIQLDGKAPLVLKREGQPLVAITAGPSGSAPMDVGISTPVPVPPRVTERVEEKYSADRDFKTPVLPPIREGFPPPTCEDEPDDARILRALEPASRGVPYLYAESRDNVQITKERLVDRIDPPRFFPLVGSAQLHHCHWKCTVNYDETIASEYPFPFRRTKPRVKVVYLDLDHLHLYPGAPEPPQAPMRDLNDP